MAESSTSKHFLYKKKESGSHAQKTPWSHVEKTAISKPRRQGASPWLSGPASQALIKHNSVAAQPVVSTPLLRKLKKILTGVNPNAVSA